MEKTVTENRVSGAKSEADENGCDEMRSYAAGKTDKKRIQTAKEGSAGKIAGAI